MKKILLSLILLFVPAAMVMAQAPQKIATVNMQEIFPNMPETKAMQTELQKLNKSYEDTLSGMNEELKKKYEDYLAKKATMPEALRLRMEQEIQDLQKRMEDLRQVALQDLQKKQADLLEPVQNKILEAIKKVGTENGYAYVLESQNMLYTGSAAIDCTAQVKAKLGLK